MRQSVVPWLLRGLVAGAALCGCASSGGGGGGGPSAASPSDIEATVVGLNGTGESAPAAMVQVRFHNRSDQEREVLSYRLEWPGGAFTADPGDLRVAAHGQVERTARVESRHGDVAALLARSSEAKIQVLRLR